MNSPQARRLFREDDFATFLDELTGCPCEHLDGAALGIAKKVADDGDTDKLTEKQLYVFNEHVIAAHTLDACKFCSQPIPWCEMHFAICGDGRGYCTHCTNLNDSDSS